LFRFISSALLILLLSWASCWWTPLGLDKRPERTTYSVPLCKTKEVVVSNMVMSYSGYVQIRPEFKANHVPLFPVPFFCYFWVLVYWFLDY
jgi:hypothetical protein